MIQYTFDEAKKARRLSRLLVTSDDECVLGLAEENGIAMIYRPNHLAQANTPTLPVVRHAVAELLSWEGYIPDMVVLLQPTSPLRIAADIDGAVDLALDERQPCNVVSIKGYATINGAVYVYNYRWLMKIISNDSLPLLHYTMPDARSIDVDTESDFETAEKFLTK